MENNHAQVSQGFRILLGALAPYIARELENEFRNNWWTDGVLNVLPDDHKHDLPSSGDLSQLVASLDPARSLLLFDLHWQKIFRKKLSIDHRTWAKELVNVWNRHTQLYGKDLSDDDTWRALDTMSRLCEQIDSENAEEIRGLLRAFRYGSADGSTAIVEASSASSAPKQKNLGILSAAPIGGLPSWRDVIEPHPDVAQGRYKNAEFVADLAQVARGEGSIEYSDPVEFFARTFVTEGMTGLLTQSLRRVCGKDGDPVIQLKTAFGGGKTHSMLALYHLMRGRVSIDKIPNVKPVLTRAGVASLPKANVAVLVGTALDPTKTKRPANMPGITINTIWGEMAAQLAESSGNLKLYDIIRESDKKGVSPGSETLKKLFDAAAPCIVLMDELVSFGKKIGKKTDLPGGTFDNFIAFIQEITEAARASKNSLVVASIPESEIEIGGEDGHKVLDTIEHTFGRMESIWKPVTANEGFEVVRRRLFLNCKNPDGRGAVCSKFSRMYNENQGDFPPGAREVEYKERMISCYPIHPEVFDRLYEDWATLERFQRTRGVLRLMAAVIHELWMGNDASLMIMPGSIPLDVPNVRDELTRHLPEGWNALVDREVDGKNSVPYQKDQAIQRYGQSLASRRVARAVMLGSAPTVRAQTVRGIESSRIRLGVVQPGESIANFNDALNTLQSALAYLYTNPSGDRFWYDTRPTLRKMVDDRATQISTHDVEYEIEKRLRLLRLPRQPQKEQPFVGLHICPASSLDVPDEQTARLVVLGPEKAYKSTDPDNNPAISEITNILNNRGTSPRIYRNMLAFIAPDQNLAADLKQAVRIYLAWKSIRRDSEDLNLDAAQNRETDNSLGRSRETVDAQINETYCRLVIPYIDKSADMKTVVLDAIRISSKDGIIEQAVKTMFNSEAIITQWSPSLLKMELDKLLWRESDHITVKRLWEFLCTYCYLPRLANEKVLMDAIQAGVNSTEYFAIASDFDGARYIDLKFNHYVGIIERSSYLVKVEAAQKQLAHLAEEESKRQAEAAASGGGATAITANADGKHVSPYINLNNGTESEPHKIHDVVTSEARKSTEFSMTAKLDNTRIGRDVHRLLDEVITHLITANCDSVEVTLKVNAKSRDGLSPQVVRTVSENCRTLRVQDFGFD